MAERKQMNVILIRHTGFPEETVSLGAKLCYSKANIEDLKAHLTDGVCAVFVELIQGEGGVMPLEPAYVEEVQKLCQEKDIWLTGRPMAMKVTV